MDPISGIGLAASIIQLGEFAFKSANTLLKIHQSLKTGAKDREALEKAVSSHKSTLQRENR
jgi:hypothetical protein